MPRIEITASSSTSVNPDLTTCATFHNFKLSTTNYCQLKMLSLFAAGWLAAGLINFPVRPCGPDHDFAVIGIIIHRAVWINQSIEPALVDTVQDL